MTMNPIRCLFQPPTQQTCQSPKREPSVTAVRRRRNLVSNCMCFCGHHMTPSFACHSQVAWHTERGAFRLAFLRINQPMLSHMPRTRSRRIARALKTGFRPGHSGACEARLYQFTGVAQGEGEPPVKRVAACDLHEALAYMRKWHPDLDILRVELVAVIEMLSGSPAQLVGSSNQAGVNVPTSPMMPVRASRGLKKRFYEPYSELAPGTQPSRLTDKAREASPRVVITGAIQGRTRPALPWPTTLGGTSVAIVDVTGATTHAPLLYVSSTEVNYQIPDTVALGPAIVTLTAGDGTTAWGPINLVPYAPGLFAVNSAGLSAAYADCVSANGQQSNEQAWQVVNRAVVAVPLNLAACQETVLVFWATGIDGPIASGVQATIGGENATVIGIAHSTTHASRLAGV